VFFTKLGIHHFYVGILLVFIATNFLFFACQKFFCFQAEAGSDMLVVRCETVEGPGAIIMNM